jgi:magnesium transporter
MHGTLFQGDGTVSGATTAGVAEALASGQFFWLDLTDLDDESIATLENTFKFHPLAVEDAEHFGQRPKMDEYDGYVYLVIHGAQPRGGGTIEVHFFYAQSYLVTARSSECPTIDALRDRWATHAGRDHVQPVMVLYRVLDALVDTFFPVLARFDDDIDVLEDAILQKPTDEQLGALFAMKRELVGLRKVVTSERDMMAELVSGVSSLPGMTPDAERYFRDLYDHLIRVSDLVDSYRDLLTGAMDTHLSTVSNRLNEVMKQLTIIATVFLPLTFLTGFFGQNFGWLVRKLNSLAVFLLLGIGLEAVAALLLVMMFRRWGWIDRSGRADRAPPVVSGRGDTRPAGGNI